MEGWTVVAAQFKAHYLQDGYSVCGMAEQTPGAVPAPDKFPRCQRCEGIVATGLHLKRTIRDIPDDQKVDRFPNSQIKLPIS